MTSMNRITLDPLSDPLWDTLVAEERSDVFHSPPWLRVLARTYDFPIRASVLTDDRSHPIAGVPYCVIDGLPAKRIATPPFSDFCDPIVSDAAEWDAVFAPLFAEDCTITVRSLHRDIAAIGTGMNVVGRAKWHGLDLAPGSEAIWEGLHGSARRAVRKAQNGGVIVRPASTLEELRSFYELHLGIRKYKYRLLAQPFEFFETIWDEFVVPGNGSLLLAFLDDKIVGGVFFLEWKGVLYYKFNASDPDLVSVRPNDLVIWTAIEQAGSKALTKLDFGLSDWDQEGLVRYKRKYASEEKTISFLRHEPAADESREAEQIRSILPVLTDLLPDEAVPDAATERAGDLLYRLFA
jgi:CelD/BcsL family acetyltransferase involved in cellulose biosynthesis